MIDLFFFVKSVFWTSSLLLLVFTSAIWYLYLDYLFRSSPTEVVLRKDVLKICSKFTTEQPCQSVITIKLFCSFIEITYWQGCSPVNLLHIFKTPFCKNTSVGLLLSIWVRFFFLKRRNCVHSMSYQSNVTLEWLEICSNYAVKHQNDNKAANLLTFLNLLSANPTKWSNTLKQFVGSCRLIVWVCLIALRGWCLKG